ncbi:MAG TPA: DegV family protein, partial [Candidatus Acidoferrum sp.]|nr:DegV family protein [Candidatus Acidoferrum sp.]
MGVTIVTDTGSDLVGADATRLGIEVVPLWIVLGEDRYRDGVDIDRVIDQLSAYLGHVKVSDTYWYLTGVPELL